MGDDMMARRRRQNSSGDDILSRLNSPTLFGEPRTRFFVPNGNGYDVEGLNRRVAPHMEQLGHGVGVKFTLATEPQLPEGVKIAVDVNWGTTPPKKIPLLGAALCSHYGLT